MQPDRQNANGNATWSPHTDPGTTRAVICCSDTRNDWSFFVKAVFLGRLCPHCWVFLLLHHFCNLKSLALFFVLENLLDDPCQWSATGSENSSVNSSLAPATLIFRENMVRLLLENWDCTSNLHAVWFVVCKKPCAAAAYEDVSKYSENQHVHGRANWHGWLTWDKSWLAESIVLRGDAWTCWVSEYLDTSSYRKPRTTSHR